MPEEVRERYIAIRLRDTREVVTVAEVLSPSKKRANSDGRREYLAKRESFLGSAVHLVELDLLRGGDRLPMAADLPGGDYCVIVSRSPQRPLAEVFAWALPDVLPSIPVPLTGEDPDVILNLQAAFDEVSQRAVYERMLDYAKPLQPPGGVHDAWIQERLGGP